MERFAVRRAAIPIGLSLLAASLALFAIDRESVTLDESISIAYARSSWPDFWSIMTTREINQSLYYVLLRGWIVLGSSEGAVRTLSAVATIATVPILYLLAEHLFGFRPALAAGLLLATNAFSVWYAQEARGYALAMLLATVCTYALVGALERPTVRWWAAYAFLATAGLYAHFFVGLVLLAHFIAVVVHPHARRELGSLLVAYAAVGVLALPIAVVILSTRGQAFAWLQFPSFDDLLVAGALLLGVPRAPGGATAPIAVAIGAIASALIVAWVFVARSSRHVGASTWGLLLVACWLLVPPIVALAASLVTPTFYPRFLIVIVPAIALVAALPLGRLPSGRVFAAAMIGMNALWTTGIALQAVELSKEDWRSATRAVLSRATDRDGIIFVSDSVATPFAYYAVKDGGTRPGLTPIFPLLDWERPRPILRDQPRFEQAIAAAGERFPRVWLIVSHDSARDTTAVTKLLDQRYVVADHESFEAIEVWVYEWERGGL
jgi:mannosyltransferase